jgi:hypothetical protein
MFNSIDARLVEEKFTLNLVPPVSYKREKKKRNLPIEQLRFIAC